MEFHYKKEDFLTTVPYEDLLSIENPFEQNIAVDQMAAYAKDLGVSGFKKKWGDYKKSLASSRTVYAYNVTEFTGQELELDAGEWRATDYGISRGNGRMGQEETFPHPITITERLVNIDTGQVKYKIAFRKGEDKKWRKIIVDKKMLSSRNSIVDLADVDVSVNSENAKTLVKYLSDLESINSDIIPETKSISRLGYIEDEGFSPYVEGLTFDGDANFKHIFECIKANGKRKKWLDEVLKIRQGDITARIVLATSFASVLVQPCGINSFFVHLWGAEAGTGKTVGLMLAASVWASPEIGNYIQTFNSTVAGREMLSAFLNNLPLIIDELQLARDNRGTMRFDVYALAQGAGRTRATKRLGVDKTPTWRNCIITSGETPLPNVAKAAGAESRKIEIECKTAHKVIEDGHGTATILRQNYGFAGREFVEKLYSGENVHRANEIYERHLLSLMKNDAAEKQAMAAAAIVTADELATEWIFKDGRAITEKEIAQFLSSREAISTGQRGYEYFCDWAAQNSNHFNSDIESIERYGVISGNVVKIIRKKFNEVAEDGGFSPQALLSYFKSENLIEVRSDGKGTTQPVKIGGVKTECVWLVVDDGDEILDDDLF